MHRSERLHNYNSRGKRIKVQTRETCFRKISQVDLLLLYFLCVWGVVEWYAAMKVYNLSFSFSLSAEGVACAYQRRSLGTDISVLLLCLAHCTYPAKLARVHNNHRMLPLLISRKSDFNYLISVIIVEGMRLFIQERRREYLTEIITNREGPIYPPNSTHHYQKSVCMDVPIGYQLLPLPVYILCTVNLLTVTVDLLLIKYILYIIIIPTFVFFKLLFLFHSTAQKPKRSFSNHFIVPFVRVWPKIYI